MYNRITNKELSKMLHETEVKIIDVREEFEFVEGHIPTAINHPLSELGQRFNELNKREHYFVVCFSGGVLRKLVNF